jgi:hypothetical protein
MHFLRGHVRVDALADHRHSLRVSDRLFEDAVNRSANHCHDGDPGKPWDRSENRHNTAHYITFRLWEGYCVRHIAGMTARFLELAGSFVLKAGSSVIEKS